MRERYEYYMLEQGHGVHDSALILETIKLRDEHVHVACKESTPGATANCPYDAVRLEYH